MPTPININFDALPNNPFGLALAHGRMKATIVDGDGEHLTIQFKCWQRGARRRISIHEADRVYIEVPNQSGWGDKIGNIDMSTGMFWQDGAADPYRVEQAMKILAVAQGEQVADRVMHPGSCMICGKELTDPVSIERGIGPDCFGNATNSAHQAKDKQPKAPSPNGSPQGDLPTDEPHIKLSSDGKNYGIAFQSKFTRELVNEFKNVTNWKGRSYDSATKIWWVAREAHNAQALLALADKYGLTVSDRDVMEADAQDEKPEVIIGASQGQITVKFDFGPNFTAILGAVRAIPTKRRFDGASKAWVVEPTKQAAMELASICKQYTFEVSDEAVEILRPLREQARREAKHADLRESLSKAEEADLDLDNFGFEPFPFQKAGIMYGDFASDRYMIADEQGLGKTIQALGRIQKKQQFPAIIVCPSAVKVKWARAAKQAFNGERTVQILEGQKPEKITADVVVCNYDILSHWSGPIISMGPKSLVLDESHYIKNRKAQRTIAAKAIAKAIPTDGSVILLSGTPILNRPIELVEQLDVMGRLEDFGGFGGFVSRYVGWEDNRWARTKVPAKNGAMNLTELNERLRRTCFVRRLKKDVLTELPEKQRDVVPVELDGDAYWKAYREAKAKSIGGMSYAEKLAEIQHLRRAAVEGKMKGVIEWITDFLESGEKLVVFARHRDVQERIHQAFPGSVRIAGGSDQSKKARQEAMDRFQNDESVKLCVVSLDAGREGIDLYAASNLAFVELGWNPGVHDQAEDRIHRIGQDRGTMMYYLLAENTIDEEMARLIEAKRRIKDAATEGQDIIDEADESMVDSLIKWIENN